MTFGINPPGLPLTTLLLCGIALASTLANGALGFAVDWNRALPVGLACGLLSCLIAFWVRRPMAMLVFALSLAAAALAGPSVGFMLVFGPMYGLGAFVAFAGSFGEDDIGGVGLPFLMLMALASTMILAFAS